MTQKESVKKYQQSEKGKAAYKKAREKYKSTEKGKDATKRASDKERMRKYLAFVAWFRSLSDDQIMRIMKSHYTKTVKTNEKYLQKYKDRYKSDSAFRQKQLEYGRQYRLKIKYDNDASV